MPLISRTLLAQRLRALARIGVLEFLDPGSGRSREYRLTPAGAEFKATIETLGAWGQRWSSRFDPQNLDAELLMWNVQRRIAVDRLPAQRTVVQFDFRGLPPRYRRAHVFWLIAARPEVDLCLKDPGTEVDLYVSMDLGSFARVWMGDLPFSAALGSGAIELTGRRDLARSFPSWLLLSSFAGVPRPAPPAQPIGRAASSAGGLRAKVGDRRPARRGTAPAASNPS